MADTMADFLSEEAVRAQRETRHWSQRAHRAEDLLRTWLATPFFADREEWAEWVREFRPAVERLLEEADNEDECVLRPNQDVLVLKGA